MKPGRWFHQKHQFRVALCGHQAVEAGATCLLLMVQGNLLNLTITHLGLAAKTGLISVIPALILTFTAFAHHFLNRWTSAIFAGVCTFFADAAVHGSHYPGEYTEAALTACGTFVFSILVSYTSLGKKIDGLAEAFLERDHAEASIKG